MQCQGKGMKMLTSKTMRQGLPVTLKQEKAGNTSLYQVKEVSKMCIKYSEIKNFIN